MGINELKQCLTKQKLEDLYITQRKTQEEIAKMYNTSSAQISTLCKYYNIPARRASRRPELRNIYPVGTKFGLWEIISTEVKVGNHRNLYQLCKCNGCGTITWKSLITLRAGHTTRCKHCSNKSLLNEYGQITGNALLLSKFRQIKHGLSTRPSWHDKEFTITPQDLQTLYDKNPYCRFTGLSLKLDKTKSLQKQNLSVDRINQCIGYTKDNIQLVDKRINMMKGKYSDLEFIKLCCLVADYCRHELPENYKLENEIDTSN